MNAAPSNAPVAKNLPFPAEVPMKGWVKARINTEL